MEQCKEELLGTEGVVRQPHFTDFFITEKTVDEKLALLQQCE